jgi:hypothetical protein
MRSSVSVPTLASAQAAGEARVVGDPSRIFLVVVGDDAQDGAENLFLRDGHIVLHIDKDRGFHEVTRFETFRMALAAVVGVDHGHLMCALKVDYRLLRDQQSSLAYVDCGPHPSVLAGTQAVTGVRE